MAEDRSTARAAGAPGAGEGARRPGEGDRPVSEGGAAIRTGLTRRPIGGEELLRGLGTHADGAVVLFLGRVREVNEGRRVARLSYEAYREMAEAELERIAREASEAHEVGEIVVLHRTGTLELGEVSLGIAVAAPHRAPCYAASRRVIERIKERLPIWKREEYADGSLEWVGAPSTAGEADDDAPGPPREAGEDGGGAG